jgi:acyl-CoA thioesterase FadM
MMKHTEHYQVKWHDTDANREVRPSQVLMYMQETANLQLKSHGIPLDDLRDRHGLGFILSRISVRIYEPLYAHDEIDVQTWICESRGLSFNRCFRILRSGTVIADAFSVWALMDIRNRRLLKVNEFEFGFSGDETLAVDLPRRVHFPVSLPVEEAGERTIRYADIDYNGHMNNTRYPDMLCDFLPNVFSKRVMGFTLSYLHEATYGHTLKVYRAETENGFLFRTVDGDGTVCLEAYMETEDRKDAKNV